MIDILRRMTFSRLDLADADPTSMVLSWSETWNPFSAYGTIVHKYLENVRNLGVHEALKRVPEEHRLACAAIELSSLPACDPDAYSSEVAFAYNVDTGEAKLLGTGLGRAYPELEGRWIFGTLDVLGETDDAVIVADYKSSFLTPAARESLQLRTGGLAAARARGKSIAHVAIVRLKGNGESYWDKATLTELDLDATEHAIRNVVARVERAQEMLASGHALQTREGEHCKYCPAFPHCPAKVGLAVALGTGLDSVVTPIVLNEETAAKVYVRLRAVEQLVERVWKSLDEFASVRPIPLENGWVYGPREKPRFTIDPEKAPAVLAEMGITVEPEVKKTITGAALEDALRRHLNGKRGIGKLTEETQKVLLEKGAATRVHITAFERHRPKPAALPETTQPQEPADAPSH